MEKNYYGILGLGATCSTTDVCGRFKSLALRHHPQNVANEAPSQDAVANYRVFSDIAEAFVVLSNPILREKYDCSGYREFVAGQTDRAFAGKPETVFDQFFGTKNFFAALVQDEAEYNEYLKRHAKAKVEEPTDITVSHKVQLLDLFRGTTFEVSFDKQVIGKDILTACKTTATKQVVLPPGFSCDKPLVFKGEGNQAPCCQNGDVTSRPHRPRRADSPPQLPARRRRPGVPP